MAIPAKMTATVLVAPHRFELQERPVPEPGDEDVLVRIRACGICGTDLKIIHDGMPQMPPYGEFIFGHEYAGDIVAVGRTVDEFQVGDRIVVEAHMGCRRCENCIRGMYPACLNYGNRTIYIDNQTWKLISFTMNETKSIGETWLWYAQRYPALSSSFQSRLPEISIYFYFLKSKESNREATILVMSCANRITS